MIEEDPAASLLRTALQPSPGVGVHGVHDNCKETAKGAIDARRAGVQSRRLIGPEAEVELGPARGLLEHVHRVVFARAAVVREGERSERLPHGQRLMKIGLGGLELRADDSVLAQPGRERIGRREQLGVEHRIGRVDETLDDCQRTRGGGSPARLLVCGSCRWNHRQYLRGSGAGEQ